MGGLATMASGLYITEAYQFTYAAIFGLAIGKFNNCCKFEKFQKLQPHFIFQHASRHCVQFLLLT